MSIFSQAKAVIFDHDGTLVDSEPAHLACWQHILAPFDKSLSASQYTQYLSGMPSIDSARWLIRTFNLDIGAEALLLAKQARFNQHLEERACPIITDVKALLAQLFRSKKPMAIASGASKAEVERSLQYHGIGHYFQAIATKDDVPNNKPAPDVYLLAAKRLNVSAPACVAIEDSDSGQSSALAAGMTCIRLNTPSRLPTAPRCHIIPNIGALLTID